MENRKIIINHRTFRSLQRSSYRCTAVFLPLAAVTQPLAAVALPLFFSAASPPLQRSAYRFCSSSLIVSSDL